MGIGKVSSVCLSFFDFLWYNFQESISFPRRVYKENKETGAKK